MKKLLFRFAPFAGSSFPATTAAVGQASQEKTPESIPHKLRRQARSIKEEDARIADQFHSESYKLPVDGFTKKRGYMKQ